MMQRPFKIADALHSLCPTASFAITANDYDQIVWDSKDIPTPSIDEVGAEIERLELERESLAYRLRRKQEYPPVGDQLDALYHAGVFPADMAAQIQAVKDAHPKLDVSA
tara:strand:+ start:359 stop:685 length:327 start_codon:yes stop_codon:yes gene_type:complete